MDNRSVHHDEHLVPDLPGASRHLSPDQFKGATSLGAVFNRTGGLGSTEMSEDAHHIQGAGRGAAKLVQEGDV